jgi:hypothetical protein
LFKQTAGNHLSGQKCPKCSKNYKYTKEMFIEKANIIHNNKYDYSLVEYKNINTDIIIICKEHGEIKLKPQYHLQGTCCYKCSNIVKNTEDFIKKSNIIHRNLYDYSMVDYKSTREPINIICKIHGIFTQIPNYHLNGNGCCKCSIGNFSKVCIEWLENIMKTENIFIQHAGNIGEKEVYINNKKIKFDGYNELTNTVYEFYGDFWHGNLKIYNENDIHPINKKTFGELYNDTINREQVIKNNGYNLITIWELDYKNNLLYVVSL